MTPANDPTVKGYSAIAYKVKLEMETCLIRTCVAIMGRAVYSKKGTN